LRRVGIRFESDSIIDPRMDLYLEAPVKLNGHLVMRGSCGAFSYIGSGSRMASGLKSIGRYCSFGQGVIIGDSNHSMSSLSTHQFQWGQSGVFKLWSKKLDFDFLRPAEKQKFVNIGNDVWIGSNSMIMRGVNVGDGAVIAAGSVVTKDVPPYAIVGGVPAKIIRYRFSEKIIINLMTLKWWRYEADSLLGVDFNNIEKAIDQIKNKEMIGMLSLINRDSVRVLGRDLLIKKNITGS
jgi:acetyltransferase-like isoleucine patch superfamily enzyme